MLMAAPANIGRMDEAAGRTRESSGFPVNEPLPVVE